MQANYLKNAVQEEPAMMIELLVDKVYVYLDRIEIILNYTGEPTKPKPRIDHIDDNPDGIQSHRGFVIYETHILMNEYTIKGFQRKDPEPKLKGTREMTAFIMI